MAKSLYAGVNGTAKKAKKIYLGVNEIAKKVKKIYVGDSNNIARQTFSLDERKMNVSAYGYLTDLPSSSDPYISSSAEYNSNTGIFEMATGSIGGYAVFTGGYETHWNSNMGTGYANKINHGYTTYYSPSLVRSYTNKSYGQTEGTASANVDNYLLFAGGSNSTGNMENTIYSYPSSTVYAIDSKFVVKNVASLSEKKEFNYGGSNSGCNVGSYALFPGGYYIEYSQYGSHSKNIKEIECYLDTLTKVSVTSLSTGGKVIACSAGSKKYCIIHEGGGSTSPVCSFDTSLTKKSCSTLYASPCSDMKYASAGDYIICLTLKRSTDTSTNSTYYSMVAKYIDSSLTVHSISSNSTPATAVQRYTGCTSKDMAAFVGGYAIGSSTYTNEAYFYNSSLTMKKISSGYYACSMACVSTDDYIIRASGRDSTDQTRACKSVYAYKLS